MSKAEILEELPKLTRGERREIQIRLEELDVDWDDDGELTENEKKLIEDRMADFERNPQTSIPWAEAEARLKSRWGE